jgi:hypothetical protein
MPKKNEGGSTTAETLCGKGFQENWERGNITRKLKLFSQYFGNLMKYWEKSLGRQTGEINLGKLGAL